MNLRIFAENMENEDGRFHRSHGMTFQQIFTVCISGLQKLGTFMENIERNCAPSLTTYGQLCVFNKYAILHKITLKVLSDEN